MSDMISRYLDTVGDGTGTIDLASDYSTVAGSVFIQPPAGKHFVLKRMLVLVQDTGSFDAAKYGNGVTLTNGIEIEVENATGGVVLDLLDGQPIKENVAWGSFCFDVDVKTWGTGDEFLVARWTFEKSGRDIELTEDDTFSVKASDDLSGLNAQRFLVQGYEYTA